MPRRCRSRAIRSEPQRSSSRLSSAKRRGVAGVVEQAGGGQLRDGVVDRVRLDALALEERAQLRDRAIAVAHRPIAQLDGPLPLALGVVALGASMVIASPTRAALLGVGRLLLGRPRRRAPRSAASPPASSRRRDRRQRRPRPARRRAPRRSCARSRRRSRGARAGSPSRCCAPGRAARRRRRRTSPTSGRCRARSRGRGCSPGSRCPTPYSMSNSACRNGAATLFLTTLTRTRLPTASVPSLRVSMRRMSSRCEE